MAEDRLEAWLDREWLLRISASVPGGSCRLFIVIWERDREDRGFAEAPLRLRRLLRAAALRFGNGSDGLAAWKLSGTTLALLAAAPAADEESSGVGGRLDYLLRDTLTRTLGGKYAAGRPEERGTLRFGSAAIRLPSVTEEERDGSRRGEQRRDDMRRAAEDALGLAWQRAWNSLRSDSAVLGIGRLAEEADESSFAAKLEVRYAPIVSLLDGSLFGYEAVPYRKRTGIRWEAEDMFAAAAAQGVLYECDRQFREAAIRGLPVRRGEAKLFLPAPAEIIYDARLYPGTTLRRMEAAGIRPEQVVLSFYAGSGREESGADEAALRSVFRHYRAQGFRIALFGIRPTRESLLRMLSLHPDYVRLQDGWMAAPAGNGQPEADYPMRLVDETLLKAAAGLARREQIVLLAGGVENESQLAAMIAGGVAYGQGEWIGSAAVVPPAAASPARDWIRHEVGKRYRRNAGSLSGLTVPVDTFERGTPVSEIARQFENRREVHSFVIVEENRPVGLIMKEKLHQMLSGQFGLPLYWNRPVEKIMDTQPMIVEESMPIDQVSQMAMAREPDKLYDAVIVTRGGLVAGVASIRSLLEWVTNARMTDARWANPLTGLPGNEPIRGELIRRIGEGRPFAVLYADLDYFKWFNDRFGFHRGDEAIRFTAEAISTGVRGGLREDSFVGHIGGDDFIAVMGREEAVELARKALQRFEQGIDAYVGDDAGPVVDRDGRPADAQGLSLSMSLLLCDEPVGWTPELLAERAALLKKEAKGRRGNALVWETLRESVPTGMAISRQGMESSS